MRVRLEATSCLGLNRTSEPILPAAEDDAKAYAPPAPYALWLDRLPRPGWLNMAIDRALLERAAAGESWLRLYAWSPSCLSFGRHEPATRRYDRERITALGLDVVRRPTGGRAVWHAGELTYAVTAPAAGFGTLHEVYREIHGMICDAVRALGAPAELAPARPAVRPDTGACFATAAGSEVVVRGRKLVGSAQLRERGALLQHGSLLLAEDQAMVARVTRGNAPPDGSAPLARLLARPVDWAEAADAVALAAAGRWGAPIRTQNLAAVEEHARIGAERFRSPAWTWDARDDSPDTVRDA